ncbi:sterol desaturase family protein [Xenococcus sp. PCC 7305]|uniref:sterol desaturase family protein n=1 Tax=Xenococcus sp. PCC 7305 TaxID=102125 RepID=UPI001930D4FF|nr:sterol desaturase family protein [Xenococcus sp. PCC 7305]
MTIISLAIVVIEWITLTITKKIESHKEGIVNISSAALTYIPIFITNKLITISLMFWIYQYRLFDLKFDWYVWILAYIGYDFMSYAIHYLSHKVRLFWCIHTVHHSPKEMKASVAFRGSFAEFILAPHLTLWLPILGFHPLLIIIIDGIGQLYGVPLHLNQHIFPDSKYSGIQKFLITPSVHRLHHAKNDIYLDRNYGLTFRIWDYLFQTSQVELQQEKPIYGISKNINSENLLVSQTDEFIELWQDIKNAPSWLDKIKYLVMPPGWNYINGGYTAENIRNNALLKL